MTHIPEQLEKINKNISEAETILSDLKNRTRTENVTEQIEHFESMLNKLNGLKNSYLDLSKQFETTNALKTSFASAMNDSQNSDQQNGMCSISNNHNVRNVLSSIDQLEQLKKERDRLRNELNEKEHRINPLQIDVSHSEENGANYDAISLIQSENLTGSDDISNSMNIGYFISVLSHHIDIGSKMIEMMSHLELNENIQQGLNLLKEVMQRLLELRERFNCVENARKSLGNNSLVDAEIIQEELNTFTTISDDLKGNFITGVKCFKSAMDIIQSYLEPKLSQIEIDEETSLENRGAVANDTFQSINNMLNFNDGIQNVEDGENNNYNSDGEINRQMQNPRNDPSLHIDDNNDGYEDSEEDEERDIDEDDDSCREKDQDESMEIASAAVAILHDHNSSQIVENNPDNITHNETEQDSMNELRLQTETEKKEIFRLLEEKRSMQLKLVQLKKAKERAQNQMLQLSQGGVGLYNSFSNSFESSQPLQLENNDVDIQGQNSLNLNANNIVNDMSDLLKLLSDVKLDENSPSSPFPRLSNLNIAQMNSDLHNGSNASSNKHYVGTEPINYNSHSDLIFSEFSQKTEELKMKHSQIQKLEEMLNQIKNDSMSLENSILNDPNDQYSHELDSNREISNIRNQKGRDSVTFQEPVATFIANEELYENMREVRMMREELRDRTARNTNSDTVVMDNCVPGAPPEVVQRRTTAGNTASSGGATSGGGTGSGGHMSAAVAAAVSQDTASQDRTTAATWGSSSAGGDLDYDDSQAHTSNSINRTDEGSRVAPIGQSSSFRGRTTRGDSTIIRNIIDSDFGGLKSQVESIAGMCRSMAVEQNRLSRDIADLKHTNSPRNTMLVNGVISSGSDPVLSNNSASSAAPLPGVNTAGPLIDSSGSASTPMMQWTNEHKQNCSAETSIRPQLSVTQVPGASIPLQMIDSNWEEASVASSNAVMAANRFIQNPNTIYGYQNLIGQQNMMMQNHNMFVKLQMSVMAAQMEQQRLLCNMASLQQNTSILLSQQQCQSQSNWSSLPSSLQVSANTSFRHLPTPFYPPPGPINQNIPPQLNGSQNNWQSSINGTSAAIDNLPTNTTLPNRFLDPDYMAYNFFSDTLGVNTPNLSSEPNWKNTGSGRNLPRH